MHVWNNKDDSMEKKWKKQGSISKDTDNKPRTGVSVDQLQSTHPVLVPQLSGKLASAYIWSAQVMVDRFSDLTYVNLKRSTTQEETLSGKVSF